MRAVVILETGGTDLLRIEDVDRPALGPRDALIRVAEALETCNRGFVLESGRIVLHGTHDTLLSDARLKNAYLGL